MRSQCIVINWVIDLSLCILALLFLKKTYSKEGDWWTYSCSCFHIIPGDKCTTGWLSNNCPPTCELAVKTCNNNQGITTCGGPTPSQPQFGQSTATLSSVDLRFCIRAGGVNLYEYPQCCFHPIIQKRRGLELWECIEKYTGSLVCEVDAWNSG